MGNGSDNDGDYDCRNGGGSDSGFKISKLFYYKNSLIKIINDKMSIYKKTYKQQNYCKENIS